MEAVPHATIYSDDHRGHVMKGELSGGRLVPPFEKPERADLVLPGCAKSVLGPSNRPGRQMTISSSHLPGRWGSKRIFPTATTRMGGAWKQEEPMSKLIIRALSTPAALGVLIAAASATPAHAILEYGGMHGAGGWKCLNWCRHALPRTAARISPRVGVRRNNAPAQHSGDVAARQAPSFRRFEFERNFAGKYSEQNFVCRHVAGAGEIRALGLHSQSFGAKLVLLL